MLDFMLDLRCVLFSPLLSSLPLSSLHLSLFPQQYLAQAHTQEFLAAMSAGGGWEAWGAASASAACVVRGVRAVLSGRCANALCLLIDETATAGGHAPSGGCVDSSGQGGVPKKKQEKGRKGWGRKGASSVNINNVAVGALYAHMQW